MNLLTHFRSGLKKTSNFLILIRALSPMKRSYKSTGYAYQSSPNSVSAKCAKTHSGDFGEITTDYRALDDLERVYNNSGQTPGLQGVRRLLQNNG